MTARKLCNALLGFAVGIFTIPLAAAAWPFAAAWRMWNETDDTDDMEAKDGE